MNTNSSKPVPNLPSQNPGKPSGPGRGNYPPKTPNPTPPKPTNK